MPTLHLYNYYHMKTPVIKLHIHNRDHFFIVDTGASHSVIIPELIPSLSDNQLKNIINGHAFGIGGPVQGALLPLKFRLLGVTLAEIRVLNAPATAFSQQMRISGLLGNDLLSQFSTVTIDYRKHVIKFEV